MWHLHQIRSNPLFFLAVPKNQEKLFLPLTLSLEKGKQFWFSAKWFLFASSLSNHLFSCSIFPKIRCSSTLVGEKLFYSFICLSQSAASGLTTEGFSKLPKFDPNFPSATAGDWKQGNELEGEWLFAFWITKLYLSLWFDVDKTIVNGVLRLGSNHKTGWAGWLMECILGMVE